MNTGIKPIGEGPTKYSSETVISIFHMWLTLKILPVYHNTTHREIRERIAKRFKLNSWQVENILSCRRVKTQKV